MSSPHQVLPTRVVTLGEPSYLDKTIQNTVFAQTNRHFPLQSFPDIQTQQAAIARDVLFALLGHEGCYVRFSDRYDPTSAHHRIVGPDYRVAKHVEVSLKSITRKLLRYGKFYSGLVGFVEIYDQLQFGRVNQSLCYEIQEFLSLYRRLVVLFEDEFRYNGTFSLNQMDNQISRKCADNMIHLYEIVCEIQNLTEQRANTDNGTFNAFLETLRNDLQVSGAIDLSTDTNKFDVCKGGLVLQIVQERINKFKGDSLSFHFLTGLFEKISISYVELLNKWLTSGEINDPFQEFFVKQNDLPTNIFYSNMEKYWDELYVIKVDGIIDQFASKDIQIKVLLTGKYLNIFKQCTGVVSFDDLPDLCDAAPSPIESLYSQDLLLKLLHFYKRANNMMLQLLFEGYQFYDLLWSLHRTFLLSDSYLIDQFIGRSFADLGRNKYSIPSSRPIKAYDDIFFSNTKMLEVIDIDATQEANTSIASVLPFCEKFSIDNNSFYEMAEGINSIKSFDADEAMRTNQTMSASNAVKRLVSRSLQRRQFGQDTGNNAKSEAIDDYAVMGVTIDVSLPFPLNLVISENSIFAYQLLFKLQMLIKFASDYTDRSWKDINFSSVWRHKSFTRPIQKLILRCRSLNLRVKGFMNELQNYINYTIVDTSFNGLKQTLSEFESTVKLRPSSQSNPSTRLGSDTFRSAYKSNNVFDDKIASSQRQLSRGTVEQKYDDVYELTNKISTYLTNMLRDSMVTNTRLLESLRAVLDVVIQYNNTVSRLKKTLILMDADLLREWASEIPEKFADVEVTEGLINGRISILNGVLNKHIEEFDNAKGELAAELRAVGTAENPIFLTLVERLDR